MFLRGICSGSPERWFKMAISVSVNTVSTEVFGLVRFTIVS